MRLKPLGHPSQHRSIATTSKKARARSGPSALQYTDRERFELSIPLQVCRFSRPVPSTTRPPVQQPRNLSGRGRLINCSGIICAHTRPVARPEFRVTPFSVSRNAERENRQRETRHGMGFTTFVKPQAPYVTQRNPRASMHIHPPAILPALRENDLAEGGEGDRRLSRPYRLWRPRRRTRPARCVRE